MEGPQKLKIKQTYEPATALLGIHLKECKSAYNRDTYTYIIITSLFTTTK
jgi:hypothetical protein